LFVFITLILIPLQLSYKCNDIYVNILCVLCHILPINCLWYTSIWFFVGTRSLKFGTYFSFYTSMR
jgi:hypothetical protein